MASKIIPKKKFRADPRQAAMRRQQEAKIWITDKQPANFLIRVVYLFVTFNLFFLTLYFVIVGISSSVFGWVGITIGTTILIMLAAFIALGFFPTQWLRNPSERMRWWFCSCFFIFDFALSCILNKLGLLNHYFQAAFYQQKENYAPSRPTICPCLP